MAPIAGIVERPTIVDLSIVIPCYNSSSMIEHVVKRVVDTVRQRYSTERFEVILVDDCSSDNTFEVISLMANEHNYIRAIGLAKNFGQQAALMAGFTYVSGDIVVCMDDDGQHTPEEILKLIARVDEGYDLVYARYPERHDTPFRSWGAKVNSAMTQVLIGKPRDITINSYFAARSYLIEEALKYRNPYPYIAGLMLRSTSSITNVEVQHSDRIAGESGYSLGGLLSLWVNGFTAFSVKPLRVASLLGVVIAIVGFASAVYVVVNRIVNPPAAVGWASMISVVLILGGLILLMLGLVGEYVGRSYISLNNSPQYVVRETINCKSDGRD